MYKLYGTIHTGTCAAQAALEVVSDSWWKLALA
jgi:hypothetical protein